MSEQCIVFGCKNKKHEGNFIGDICSPCYEIITKGEPQHISTNFIHSLYCENKKLSKELATIRQQPLSGSQGSPKSYSPFEDSIEYHDSIGE